ncbi:MAG: hypothetical protein MUF07_13065 [Steroidobacteraceae bacterium]|jgi:lipid-binding SYLF domain-containing protein|nr:hypothetical protein [Steroidobacteraceae bacterium]
MPVSARHRALLLLAFLAPTAAFTASDKVARQQEDLRKMARSTIEELYRLQPRSQDALKNAAGYAVFSNFGLKILVGGGGSGNGVAFDREGRNVTYMKMAEIQAGLGVRAKKYRQVWVFENASDLERFTNSGWELGGQATLSAKLNGEGGSVFTGALSVRPGVWLYQLSGDGLAADLTAKGTRYYRNKALN